MGIQTHKNRLGDIFAAFHATGQKTHELDAVFFD